MLAPDQYLALETFCTPNGHVYELSVRDSEFRSSNVIAVTDERLLTKLRSVNGQYVYVYKQFRTPIFYCEYLRAPAPPGQVG